MADWVDVGAAEGAVQMSVFRVTLGPGEVSGWRHRFDGAEQVAFVVSGDGSAIDADGGRFPVAADSVVMCADGGPAGGFEAGESGLVVVWCEVSTDAFPRRRDVVEGPVPGGVVPAAPPVVLDYRDVEPVRRQRGEVRNVWYRLGPHAGFVASSAGVMDVEANARSNVPHCHTAEEELFVVLEGDAKLELTPTAPEGVAGLPPDPIEEQTVKTGDVVVRSAGTGISHSFLTGAEGLRLFAYSRRDSTDICYYPRSGKISIRGVRGVFPVSRTDYWTGEG